MGFYKDIEKSLLEAIEMERGLAGLTNTKQQSISRIEKKEHSPSLKLFYSLVHALGYDLKICRRLSFDRRLHFTQADISQASHRGTPDFCLTRESCLLLHSRP